MEIWLDTSNVALVAEASKLGILQGITTNPSILSLSVLSPKELVIKMLEVQQGLVAIQVLSDDIEEMCKQGGFFRLSPTES